MGLWSMWKKKKPDSQDEAPALDLSGEPFEYDIRMVWLPPQGDAMVWKTRTLLADDRFIYMPAPTGENGLSLPPHQEVTVYLMDDYSVAEFDCHPEEFEHEDGPVLRVERPTDIPWKARSDQGKGGDHARRYIRADVTIHAEWLPIVRTVRGMTRKTETPARCMVVDLSLEGAQILTDVEMLEQSLLLLVFPPHIIRVQMEAKVVRSREVSVPERPEFPWTAALLFTQVDDIKKSLIGQYIVEREKNKLPLADSER